jgi:UDP-N-acetylmuramoyl-tripeptide--D-alanyl-D-alanine ligase
MKLETVAKHSGADAQHLSPALLNVEVNSFAIDSREVKAGEVFFALAQPDYKNNGFNGEFADSHQFIAAAFEKGAVACVARADKVIGNPDLEKYLDRLLLVDDAIAALQKLAAAVYREWGKPVIGITGSAGKTTAKELTAQVFAENGFRVLRNIKNYNNGLGLPLTVLRLLNEGEFDVAVLEMGMSTPMNEIQRLCRITPPDVAIELNVLPVHLENLGTIENIAAAKAELVEGLKNTGTAVLNADNARVMAMREKVKSDRVISYGIENPADVSAADIEFERFGLTEFTLNTPNGSAKVSLKLNGRHNVMNALAAAAAGHSFGLAPEDIARALGTLAPPPMRGEVLRFKAGFDVVNDSYNSNPDALLGMVTTLVEGGAKAKRKIVVAGEMMELGPDAPNLHTQTGAQIASSGIDMLCGVRGLAQQLVVGAKGGGLADAQFFPDSESAGEFLANEVKMGDLVLVKGSRSVKTERVVEKLLEKFEVDN